MIKILVLDIETSPIDAYAWGLKKQFIDYKFGMKQPQRVLCWAAKWLGQEHVMYSSERTHGHKDMINMMWQLVDEADAIVHYNGTSFDMRHLNREFLECQLTPPSSYKNIDLYHKVKGQFNLPSYRLDYVGSWLGVGQKLETPGMKLWVDVLNNKTAAWKLMEEYNIEDVNLTERVYQTILPWIKGHPNVGLYMEPSDKPYCTNCGSQDLHNKGLERTNVLSYRRYKCRKCGKTSRERKAIAPRRTEDVLC